MTSRHRSGARFPALLSTLLLALLVVTGCGDTEPDDTPTGKDHGMDAASMKQQVDDAVLALGPGLTDALQAEVRAAGGQFTGCQMTDDQWQYIANVGLFGPADANAGDLISRTARKAGFEDVSVTPPGNDEAGSVTAHKGEVQLRVLLAASGKPATVHNVEVYVDCTPLDAEGQKFAEDDPGSDYAELK